MSNNKQIQQGWECPKCGSIYSPLTSKCNICPQNILVGTSTSNTLLCTKFVSEEVGTSSTSRCANCGRQKWQHPIITPTI